MIKHDLITNMIKGHITIKNQSPGDPRDFVIAMDHK